MEDGEVKSRPGKISKRRRSSSESESEKTRKRKSRIVRPESSTSSSSEDEQPSSKNVRSRSPPARSRSSSRSLSRSSSVSSQDGTALASKVSDDEESVRESSQTLEKYNVHEVSEDEDEVVRDEDEPVTSSKSTADSLTWDFDRMLQRKRDENRRYRKRTGIDVINDNDDAIARMIADMRQAARDDRNSLEKGSPATKKIGMLPSVMSQLNKSDLLMAFIEANILSVITDWLAPIGEQKILPHVQIRNKLLQFCNTIPIDTSRLKESGVGKAIMFLSRHPKETKENRDVARKLISKWSRPIFNLDADFASMSREERQRRDREMAAKLREIAESRGLAKAKKADQEAELNAKPLRPGDPGWVCRARVPMVDNREYVVRPEWQSTADLSHGPTKKSGGMSLYEKHKRLYVERKRNSKTRSGVKLSLEGKNSFNV